MSFHYHHLDKWLCANLDLVEEALETHEKAIVVIGGASSSGKSFCARQLKDYLSHHHHRALILSLDQYDYGLSGIIPNKVQENFFKEPLPHLEEIEAAIKEIIYSVPFDKKYSEPVLQKIAPKIRPYFSSEKDFETFRKALPIEWKRLNFDEPSVYNLKEAAEDVNILYEGGKITEKLYSKVVSERLPSTNTLNGRKFDTILIEGIYALNPVFLNALNRKEAITDFVDGNPKSLFLRRILRDAKTTSADTAFTMSIYFRYIVRSYQETILPGKERADVVFSNEMTFEEMRSGNLYTTKNEIIVEDKEKVEEFLKETTLLSRQYQRDYFFTVPGEAEKSENILRLRLLSNDGGKTYQPSSLVHKGVPKVRKDNKIIRPINVLIKEGEFNKVFASTEECLSAFDSAGFLVSAPLDKQKEKLLWKKLPVTLRRIREKYYLEYSDEKTGEELKKFFFQSSK